MYTKSQVSLPHSAKFCMRYCSTAASFVSGSRQETTIGSSEHSDEPSHFAKGRGFLDWLPLSASQQGLCPMELIIWLVSDVTVSVKHHSGVTDTWRKSKLSIWNWCFCVSMTVQLAALSFTEINSAWISQAYNESYEARLWVNDSVTALAYEWITAWHIPKERRGYEAESEIPTEMFQPTQTCSNSKSVLHL
jgi:hypothetical protein